jgi:hypothetical protein
MTGHSGAAIDPSLSLWQAEVCMSGVTPILASTQKKGGGTSRPVME